jgi:predicted transcriptional regulator
MERNTEVSVYLALSNDDRRAIMGHLSRSGGAASNRELAALIGKSDEWTRVQLVMLADAGLITRTHGPGAADAVRNTLANGIVWPVGLSVEQCRVLSVPERVAVMDHLARSGQQTVGDIVKALGLRQGQVSKHLQSLVTAGLVSREHRERKSYWHTIADSIVWPMETQTCP